MMCFEFKKQIDQKLLITNIFMIENQRSKIVRINEKEDFSVSAPSAGAFFRPCQQRELFWQSGTGTHLLTLFTLYIYGILSIPLRLSKSCKRKQY